MRPCAAILAATIAFHGLANAASTTLVIQEVDAVPALTGGGEKKHEWVEILNKTTSPFQLNGI